MRLVTFQNSVGASRIGAFVEGGQVVDLNSACSLYLKEIKRAGFERMADALVPSNMRGSSRVAIPALMAHVRP